jgi:hypothetical protein
MMPFARHNIIASVPPSLLAVFAVVTAVYLVVKGTPDRYHDTLQVIGDFLGQLEEGHDQPLRKGHSGSKMKQD